MGQLDFSFKRKQLERFLELGKTMIVIDSRVDGVDVPEYLIGDYQLRLNLSLNFGLPVELDKEGAHATLTFRGSPYHCTLPWRSIYAVISHASEDSQVFAEDVPMEMLLEASSHEASSHDDSVSPSSLSDTDDADGKERATSQPTHLPRPLPATKAGPTLVAVADASAQRSKEPTKLTELNGNASTRDRDQSTTDPDPDPPKRRPSHLRVVK